MKSLFLDKEFAYDGSQLKSLFGYLDHGVQGNSVVSWVGSCDIPRDHIVDGEDLLAGETIAGSRMVHFIVERFETSMFTAVAMQRLFASIVLEHLMEAIADGDVVDQLKREGDDIYFGQGKLSISIATLSPMSALIHFAVNVSNEGTPVRTACLADLGLEPQAFAVAVMKRFTDEVASIENATTKVRWVK